MIFQMLLLQCKIKKFYKITMILDIKFYKVIGFMSQDEDGYVNSNNIS